MAIFYKWIKGCPSGTEITQDSLTFLEWKSNTTPSITIGMKDYGNITTTKQEYKIDWKWTFYNGLKIGDFLTIESQDYTAYLNFKNDAGIIKGETTTFSFGCTTIKANNLELESECKVKSLIATGTCEAESLTASGACTAQYFNATSDMRAKENIKPATYNALEFIKKLSVYTYNYKGQEETVTGILAQDLLANQPKELNLVSNEKATGINNDYMSIKNDKLMFVLLKAIQEQEQKIEELEHRLKELQNR